VQLRHQNDLDVFTQAIPLGIIGHEAVWMKQNRKRIPKHAATVGIRL
jgi:hypothetical protein